MILRFASALSSVLVLKVSSPPNSSNPTMLPITYQQEVVSLIPLQKNTRPVSSGGVSMVHLFDQFVPDVVLKRLI
jgi:hypothetical protein